MAAPPSEGTAPKAASDRAQLPRFGPARLREITAIARMYRSQAADSRRFYHPLPFDPFRLVALLTAMIVLQIWVRFWSRTAPSLGILLWVARDAPSPRVVGMATGRFYRDARGRLVARTGLFIDPNHRRAHRGRDLGAALLAECRRLRADRAEALILPDNDASRRTHESLGYTIRPTVFHDRHLSETDYLLGSIDLAGPGSDVGASGTAAPERAVA